MKGKMIYVAGPYAGDIEANIKRAEEVSITLIKNGFHVMTPHKNTSGYEKYEDDIITVQTWIDLDIDMLSRCDALYVMPNFQDSKGTLSEIDYAYTHDIPVIYAYDHPCHSFTLEKYYKIVGE